MRITACFASLLASGCAWRQGALQPLGPKSMQILQLGAVFFWTSLAVLSLVVAAAVWAFVRGRRSGQAAGLEPLAPSATVERQIARAVAASTVVSLALLGVLLVASIATGQSLADFAPPRPLRIKVTAHQWWWKIEYPGDKPEDEAVTANELHIPVGVPVELELTSADVIHSFWLPNLDGKHDLIPSRVLKTVIQADVVGSYAGRCAEFCGAQHAHMDLLLVAQPPSEFQAWLATQRQPAAEPQTSAELEGREIVERSACALCHTVSGTKALGGTGPDLSHFASRLTLAAGAAPRQNESLRSWLRNPQQLKPGSQMPAIDLAPADLSAVVAYLETLR